MTKTELESLRAKYADLKGDASFSVVSRDINEMLDALPESPRNTLLRAKYLDQKADHSMPGWIAQGDVELLAKEIVTIEPDSPIPPKGEEAPSGNAGSDSPPADSDPKLTAEESQVTP